MNNLEESSELQSLNSSGRSNASPASTVRSRKWPFFKKKMIINESDITTHSSQTSLVSMYSTAEPELTHAHSVSEPPQLNSLKTSFIDSEMMTSDIQIPEPISNLHSFSTSTDALSASSYSPRKRSMTDPPSPLCSNPAPIQYSQLTPPLPQKNNANQDSRLFQRMFPQLHFTGEILIKSFSCAVEKDIIMQGKMFLTPKNLCFYSNVFNLSYCLVVPFKDISSIEKKNTIGFVPNAIKVVEKNSSHSFISFIKRDLAFDLMMQFYCYSSVTSKITDMSLTDSMDYQYSTTKTNSTDSSLPHYLIKDTECNCEGHYGQELMSVQSNQSVSECFDLLLGDSSHKLWINAYKSTGMTGIFIGNWIKGDSQYKRTILYTASLKLPNLNSNALFCIEKQDMKWIQSDTLVIDCQIKIQKAAYIDVFVILLKYCISLNNLQKQTVIKSTAQIHFLKKSVHKGIVLGKIEQVIFDWLHLVLFKMKEGFRQDNLQELKQYTASKISLSPLVITPSSIETPPNKPDAPIGPSQSQSLQSPFKQNQIKYIITFVSLLVIAIAYVYHIMKTKSLSDPELKILLQTKEQEIKMRMELIKEKEEAHEKLYTKNCYYG